MNSVLAERGLRAAPQLAATKPHGVRLRYMAGCRCLKCRMANTNYETARAKARAAGDWNGIVDAAPARRHILELSSAGVGYVMVAAAASVARTVVFEIRQGRKLRARARTVRQICAVTTDCRGDSALVSARGTWQKIRLLLEEGYTKADLARRLGRESPHLQIQKDRVTVRTRADVERLYRKLTT